MIVSVTYTEKEVEEILIGAAGVQVGQTGGKLGRYSHAYGVTVEFNDDLEDPGEPDREFVLAEEAHAEAGR